MGRAPCCDKSNVKKGPWSPEEDSKLKQFIEQHGTGGNWIALPHKAGLKRCGKSCRLRWLNYLRPNIKHGEFSETEDRIICSLFASIGSRWSIIASQLPGRTDNDIKNYWNTKLKKKLFGLSITSSSPFSQRRTSPLQHPQPPSLQIGTVLPASTFLNPFLFNFGQKTLPPISPESLSTSSSSSYSPNSTLLAFGGEQQSRFEGSFICGNTGMEGSSGVGYDELRRLLLLGGDGEVCLEEEDGSTRGRAQWRCVDSTF